MWTISTILLQVTSYDIVCVARIVETVKLAIKRRKIVRNEYFIEQLRCRRFKSMDI